MIYQCIHVNIILVQTSDEEYVKNVFETFTNAIIDSGFMKLRPEITNFCHTFIK